MSDHPLFDFTPRETARTAERLDTQLARVRALMRDGTWRTLGEIHARVQGGEPSLSARLRDLRREGFLVDRRKRAGAGPGLWEYRVTWPGQPAPAQRAPSSGLHQDFLEH